MKTLIVFNVIQIGLMMGVFLSSTLEVKMFCFVLQMITLLINLKLQEDS